MFRYYTHTFSNGIRLVHRRWKSKVAYLAVIINAGSRDEFPDKHGIAHFTEHMLFKGTYSKNSRRVIRCLEDVGGEVDAFTTKEETVLFSAFPVKYYEKGADLFSDILFNSTFPENETDKEREVIIDEINSYKDNPAEQIFEEFEELIFNGHPLSKSILGSKKTLKSITRKDISRYVKEHYCPGQIVVCSMGDISFDDICKITEKTFGIQGTAKQPQERKAFGGYKPARKEVKKRSHQAHCIIGTEAYSYFDDKRIPFSLMTNILGGPAMMSRLNMILREKYGLVYNIEAGYTPYSDTGTFSVYFGSEYKNYEKSFRLVMKEIEMFAAKRLSPSELSQAKRQFIGQQLISLENPETLLLGMGKTYMLHDQKLSIKNMAGKIQDLTADEMLSAAQILRLENLSVIVYR